MARPLVNHTMSANGRVFRQHRGRARRLERRDHEAGEAEEEARRGIHRTCGFSATATSGFFAAIALLPDSAFAVDFDSGLGLALATSVSCFAPGILSFWPSASLFASMPALAATISFQRR